MAVCLSTINAAVNTVVKGEYLEENGVTIHVKDGYTTPEKAKPFFNPRMKTCRELVLATLGAFIKECGHQSPVNCLDAFGASGVAGMQWKTRFGKFCHVTITERDEICVQSIMGNSISNGFVPKPFILEFTRIPGLPFEPQERNEICVKQCDVSVMLHMEAFDFIHLDPFGCPVKYLTAAFTNMRNNGLICVVATDLGSLLAKNANVAFRNYAANVVKTEYVQEAGARVLIAAAVRAAAQCSKGVEVLYAVNKDHFLIVGLRVRRGAVSADSCVQSVCSVVHCQICGERVSFPPSQHLTDNPYDALPCCCHKDTAGRTAVLIGPLWCGSLFDATFVEKMFREAVSENLSKAVVTLLSTLLLEAVCPNSVSEHLKVLQHIEEILKASRQGESEIIPMVATDGATQSSLNAMAAVQRTENRRESVTLQSGKRQSCVKLSGTNAASCCQTECNSTSHKTDLEDDPKVTDRTDDTINAPKRAKLCDTGTETLVPNLDLAAIPCPMFYYDLHKKKLPGLNLPKTSKVISVLQTSGFKASRTHFCTTAVRTNANLTQILQLLQ
ncbi:TRMT1-like protein [Liolophura sinensis]|uniref:TRMT1-like protein n=1 Tax=Liolophura sinensis TaxID=3198878 RepID=UPI003158880D